MHTNNMDVDCLNTVITPEDIIRCSLHVHVYDGVERYPPSSLHGAIYFSTFYVHEPLKHKWDATTMAKVLIQSHAHVWD